MDLIKISSYQNLSIDNFGYQRSYLYKIKEYEDYFITLPYWGYYKKSNTVVETEVKLCKLIPSDSFGTRATFITLIEDPNRYKKKDLQKNLENLSEKFITYLKTLSLEEILVNAKLEKM